jgi:hypothetical protein
MTKAELIESILSWARNVYEEVEKRAEETSGFSVHSFGKDMYALGKLKALEEIFEHVREALKDDEHQQT